ncbi:hypothetical protein [Aeoliella mucimassa]|uniref:Uncharacterized protein n=1 Tax=Aeoliella mucimassa TaxID=2527972 RepID=A0A518ASG1_9BACT|nr:hypothetical protein [Aeoliella mucimassa]QDU57673.1 hypothetical protein Pan181_38930 [Aeoliella mucimassa]
MLEPVPCCGRLRRSAGCCAVLAVLVGLILSGPRLHAADVVVDEGFDGPMVSWKLEPAPNVRQVAQLRTQLSNSQKPASVERVVMTIAPGYGAHLKHQVEHLPVLDELAIEVVMRSNRAAVQLAAEVVFPRNIDSETGQPLRTTVVGQRYSNAGQWQRLRLDSVPKLATRQARFLSTNPNVQVDDREAYVDRVVLVVPGGSGETLVEVDQMQVVGVLTQPGIAAAGPLLSAPQNDGPMLSAPGNQQSEPITFDPVEVRRHGTTISVAGEPLVPRAIEYHGESFSELAELGFNTVYLASPATEAQLRAAREAKLWVVCPPPELDRLVEIAPNSIWQTVLAWSLGLENTALSLDQLTSQCEAVRRADPLRRPIVVGASDRPRRFAQLTDVLVRPRKIDLAGDANVGDVEKLAPVLGCSPWVAVSLGWSDAAREQAELLAPSARYLGWHEPWQIRQALLATMAAGHRGLLVRTPGRLASSSPEARRLCEQLRLLNRELMLAEPWLVTGKRIAGAELRSSNQKSIAWQLGRSRLVFLPGEPPSQQPASTSPVLVVAGVPENSKAHLLTPAGLVPLRGERVTGGFQVPLTRIASPRWVVLTDDSLTLAQIERRLGNEAPQAAQAARTLAMADVMELETVMQQLLNPQAKALAGRVAAVRQRLEQCDQLLASRKYAYAIELAQTSSDQTAEARQQLFKYVTATTGFASIPTEYDLRLLPTHQALQPALASLVRGQNLLVGGDFEDLASTQSAGWVHTDYADSQHDTAVEFSPRDPQHGRACLRLVAKPTSQAMFTSDDDPPSVVWVTSPRVPLQAGSVVEITGWIRVVGSAEANGKLLIQDTLGGQELALRVPTTAGWQPFRMVRTVNQTSSVQLHLAVQGGALADIDAVMVRPISVPRRTANQSFTAPPRQ